MSKMCIFSISNIKMATQKFTNFDVKMHADMTAVTIHTTKIVLQEAKDNEALLKPSYRKNPNELFGQPIHKEQTEW